MSNFILKFSPIRTFDDVIRRDGDLMWKILGNIHWTLLRKKPLGYTGVFFNCWNTLESRFSEGWDKKKDGSPWKKNVGIGELHKCLTFYIHVYPFLKQCTFLPITWGLSLSMVQNYSKVYRYTLDRNSWYIN